MLVITAKNWGRQYYDDDDLIAIIVCVHQSEIKYKNNCVHICMKLNMMLLPAAPHMQQKHRDRPDAG